LPHVKPHCFFVVRRPYLGNRPSFPSPGGEGRVRGLFLSMGEAQNNEVKTAPGKREETDGSQTFKMLQVALYHALGNLPESEFTHEFF